MASRNSFPNTQITPSAVPMTCSNPIPDGTQLPPGTSSEPKSPSTTVQFSPSVDRQIAPRFRASTRSLAMSTRHSNPTAHATPSTTTARRTTVAFVSSIGTNGWSTLRHTESAMSSGRTGSGRSASSVVTIGDSERLTTRSNPPVSIARTTIAAAVNQRGCAGTT